MTSEAAENVDYHTKMERKKRILDLMEKGDWQSVLAKFDEIQNFREPLLVWIRPNLECLKFIEIVLQNLGISKVVRVTKQFILRISRL